MFFSGSDRRQHELQLAIRRILDLTTLNLAIPTDRRREERYSRILPALFVPWDHRHPAMEKCTTVLTKDISDHGMALIVPKPVTEKKVLVGLWLHTEHLGFAEAGPIYFICQVRNCRSIGGGYWQTGVELESLAKSTEILEALQPLANELLPEGSLRQLPMLSSAGRGFV